MICVSLTESGKTMGFTIPIFMVALDMELRFPSGSGKVPFGLLLSPSR